MIPVKTDKLNSQQKAAVLCRNRSLLVSAGAGSGKTFVLSRRILSRLFDEANPVDADKLLVVTFTNAAAAEMKNRIMTALTELAIEHPENETVLRQQMLMEGARICTVDSFCLDLVRRYASELGLEEDFVLGDENRLQLMREKALSDLLEEEYRTSDPAFNALAAHFTKAHDRPLREIIQEVDAFLQSLPFPDRWMDEKLAMYSADADFSSWLGVLWRKALSNLSHAESLLKKAWETTEGLDLCTDIWHSGLSVCLGQVSDLMHDVQQRDLDRMTGRVQSFVFEKIGTPRGYGQHPDIILANQYKKEANDLVKELQKWFYLTLDQLKAQMESLRPVSEKLMQLVAKYRLRLLEEKKKAGQYDFSDIEVFAANLLFTQGPEGALPTPLARELAEDIQEIYIDEFQDINRLQHHLFSALAKPDNLFLVGDVKQSIYRFRQASPDIFLNLKDRWPHYEDCGSAQSVLSLPVNYRSAPAVIDALNFFFRQLMHTSTAEIEYTSEEELVCGEPEKHLPTGLFSLLLIDTQEESSAARAEGRSIAAEIENLVGKESVPGADGPRLIRYSDICILVRSRSDNDELMTALREFQIPVTGDESGDFFKLPEILSTLSLLRAINNPTRDIPLLAAMMSPFYAFTPDEMGRIRENRKNSRLYASVLEYSIQENGLGDKCRSFLAQISEFRRLSTLLGTAELIHTIADVTGFYAAASAMPGGGNRAENVRRLVYFAEEYEQNASRSLASFLRYTDRLSSSPGGSNEGMEAAADSNQVRILSIHKSKGLEFPICFVAGGHRKFNQRDQSKPFAAHRELGFAMKQTSPDGTYTYLPLLKQVISEQARLDSLAEEMRIWYVALSRAKSRLILTVRSPKVDKLLQNCASNIEGDHVDKQAITKAATPAEWFVSAAMLHPSGQVLRDLAGVKIRTLPAEDCWDIRLVTPPQPPQKEDSLSESPSDTVDEELLREIDLRLSWQYPWQELTTLPRKYTVSELAKETSALSELTAPDFSTHESGASRGSATHRFMELCDFTQAALDLEKEIERLVTAGMIAQREGALVNRKTTASFFGSKIFSRIEKAQRVERERNFICQLPAGRIKPLPENAAEEKVILQGCADCVVFEPDGLLLIDYKTDRMDDPQEYIDRYALQLQLYAEAISEMYCLPVREKYIFSFHLGTEIPIP